MAQYNYSPAFISRLKTLLPNSKEMITMAERGDFFLGRLLDDSSANYLSLDTILNATSLEELKTKAKEMQSRIQLYNLWSMETQHWN